MNNKINIQVLFSIIYLLFITLVSCNPDKKEEVIEESLEVEIDSTASTLVRFNNALFSIPSPHQIGFLIKEKNIDYNKEYLNLTSKSHNYTNNFKKALNLGVYGANLGYLNIYDQIPDAISYFSVIKVLSQEIGISNAFDMETINRIEKNMGNKDSLLQIISNTYRKADTYLKDNNRNDIGVLILAGGWVESLYIMAQILLDQKDQEIINRVGEQKHPLDNLIKILSPYYNQSEEYSQLIDGLIDLAYEFDGIECLYTYVEPTVDPENKLTIINSKSEVIMSDEQLKTITNKVNSIRNKIIE